MLHDSFDGIAFSRQLENFRQSLNDPEDYALFCSDVEEISNNPQVDGVHIFDHPEGRVAWTERFRFVFSTNAQIFFKEISRRGIVPRADEPLGP